MFPSTSVTDATGRPRLAGIDLIAGIERPARIAPVGSSG
jgi:hypothetical protein